MNRMDIYVGARRSGKTATLIKKSAETGAYIVAPSRCMADYIRKQANDMGYDIPEPFSVEEIFRMKQNKHFMNTDIMRKGLLVDEAQILLQQFFAPAKIWGTTVTDFGDNIEYLNSDKQISDAHEPERE